MWVIFTLLNGIGPSANKMEFTVASSRVLNFFVALWNRYYTNSLQCFLLITYTVGVIQCFLYIDL